MTDPVPVIAVVGPSGVGKTRLVEALIAELVGRGYRVGAIKHSRHGFVMDLPGKDTWRYARAGASGVAISTPGRVGVIRQVEGELRGQEVVALLPGVDLVVAEGFGGEPWPKVEVRGARPSEREYRNVVAVVSAEGGVADGQSPSGHGTPTFTPYQVSRLADCLEGGCLRGCRRRE
ncbi:MAG: molybdopterin-guanine dinucleotide biosynthesis protein B [Acetobacteraceae bacterium]|nr:molybdopterin-guanine dinucleotide biosynthesis protein B [Acetobacteraceae bacterium]